jgi:hypothetical protein
MISLFNADGLILDLQRQTFSDTKINFSLGFQYIGFFMMRESKIIVSALTLSILKILNFKLTTIHKRGKDEKKTKLRALTKCFLSLATSVALYFLRILPLEEIDISEGEYQGVTLMSRVAMLYIVGYRSFRKLRPVKVSGATVLGI